MSFHLDNIPTTVHRVEEPEPILPPMTAGVTNVHTEYTFYGRTKVRVARVISSNPGAPTKRYPTRYL